MQSNGNKNLDRLIYLVTILAAGQTGWALDVVTQDMRQEGIHLPGDKETSANHKKHELVNVLLKGNKGLMLHNVKGSEPKKMEILLARNGTRFPVII